MRGDDQRDDPPNQRKTVPGPTGAPAAASRARNERRFEGAPTNERNGRNRKINTFDSAQSRAARLRPFR